MADLQASLEATKQTVFVLLNFTEELVLRLATFTATVYGVWTLIRKIFERH